MARTKQTARKTTPAKPTLDKRRSPRLKQLAAKEPEDYDDEPAPEAEDTDYRQTAKQTRSDNTLERQDDRANVAAEAALSTPGYGWANVLKKKPDGKGALRVWIGRRRRSMARTGRLALLCDSFKSQGYGAYEEGDDHPACVEQQYRDAGFDWDDPASRAMIDKVAVVCKEINHSVPVPNNQYMLVQWVEYILEEGARASPARRVKFRAAARTVVGLVKAAARAMDAIARVEGPPDCCDGCAVDAIGLLENHEDVEEITLGGLVVTRDGRGGLCGNQINYFTAPSC